MKTCTKCQTPKELTEFTTNRAHKDQKCSACKACQRVVREIWDRTPNGIASKKRMNAKKKAHILANKAIWQRTAKGRLRAREYALSSKYGITLAQYEALLMEQDGKCAICIKPETVVRGGKLLPLSVDHDHGTGKVRKLLCGTCNSLIGLAQDQISILEASIRYLQSFQPLLDNLLENQYTSKNVEVALPGEILALLPPRA